MENGTKLRLLYLYQHLVNHTDAEHPLSTMELIDILNNQYSLQVTRNTISNDLKMLHDSGLGIEHFTSTQNRYYYDGGIFDIAELKILIDAVASSKFITQRKSEQLIEKLASLTNYHYAEQLQRNIFVQNRVKSDNEKGYYIVDSINEAINTKKKIRFLYTDYDINKNRCVTNNGKPYTVSPYALVWDGDYYYMRGYCDERKGMRNFRIDRIGEQPEILQEDAVNQRISNCLQDYNKLVFHMYDTDALTDVQLECDASMMKYIIDQFGVDVETCAISNERFIVKTRVCTSETFYSWVFGFGGLIKIVSPASTCEEYKIMLQKSLDNNGLYGDVKNSSVTVQNVK